MRAVTPAFKAAVRSSHEIAVRADLWYGGACVAPDLAITGGKLTITDDDIIRGHLAEFAVADPTGELVPTRGHADGMHVYGATVHLRAGLVLPGGPELVSLGWYVVRDVKVAEGFRRVIDGAWISAGATITADCLDRMVSVQDARFLTPHTPPPGATCLGEIRRLCAGLLPVGAWPDLPDRDVPSSITYEESRLDAVASLAAAAGVSVFADDDGALMIAPAKDVAGDPVAYLSTAYEVTATGQRYTRDQVYNGVAARGETEDGTPVYGLAVDEDPASPTYWGGPFGQVPAFYSSPLLDTPAQAQQAAETYLHTILYGRDRTEEFTAVPDPSLEPGDIVQVDTPRAGFVGILTSIDLPLTAAAGAATYKARIAGGGGITTDTRGGAS